MIASNFFKLSEGRWMTQRTIHKINVSKLYIHKSEVSINYSGYGDKINYGPIKVMQRSIVETSANYIIEDLLDYHIVQLYLRPNNKDLNRANIKVIQDRITCDFETYTNQRDHTSISSYVGELQNFEKVWFVNPNLRLGVSTVKKFHKLIAIAFTSDIKIV
uniref:Chromophore lyase n=1 Tax=Balbiania investiens TaxID=111861 RepID=A0A4D6BL42_9FLOR|nr:Chromophore lyase [Balbiania investiens]QBX88676.1 Chromophore lyase [Balbiania investiens]